MVVDSAGGVMMGEITDKEIIEGRYIITVGAYGKFLVTKEQYESVAVGDDVPGFFEEQRKLKKPRYPAAMLNENLIYYNTDEVTDGTITIISVLE